MSGVSVALRVSRESSAGNAAHGNQLGAANACELEFGGLTNVDQGELLAGLQAQPDFLRRDFERSLAFGHTHVA